VASIKRNGEILLGGPCRALELSYVLSYAYVMRTMTASMARANLYRLLEETAESSEPVQITGRKGSSVLVSERDWRALQETVYLLSVPGCASRSGKVSRPRPRSAPRIRAGDRWRVIFTKQAQKDATEALGGRAAPQG